MTSTQTKHLSYHELHSQLWDCHIGIVELSLVLPQLKTVVIRTETGDHYLAAIHREGDTLVFDLGQPVEAMDERIDQAERRMEDR